MFKDQLGNVLTVGDVVIYSQGRYGGSGVPTLAKITKMVSQAGWGGNVHSYISVSPLGNRYDYHTKTFSKGFVRPRPLKKPERVIKVDAALVEQALQEE